MRAIECVEHACSVPQWLQGPYSAKVASQMDCYSMRQSLGVCVGVTPFNFPVMISTWLAIPAIACGNAVIIKPSEKNPSSVLFMAELLRQAGLPDGVFNVVNGDKDAVEYLIQHDDVKAVACVGSTPVAAQFIRQQLLMVKGLKPLVVQKITRLLCQMQVWMRQFQHWLVRDLVQLVSDAWRCPSLFVWVIRLPTRWFVVY